MGHVYANITLLNAVDVVLAQRGDLFEENVRTMEVNAMVDSGAMTLIINGENCRTTRLSCSETHGSSIG